MFDLTKIEAVELEKGSHDNPESGLCFMEMVAWFEGEQHSDKPDCACPVLGSYGIELNDRMPHDIRNKYLRPLVPLMAGTRDDASKLKRAEFLALWATNKVLPIILRDQYPSLAKRCEQAETLGEAKSAAEAAAEASAYTAKAAAYAAYTAAYAAKAAAYAAADAADAASYTAKAAAYAAAEIWEVATEGLRQAILIGSHDGFTALDEAAWTQRSDKLLELV